MARMGSRTLLPAQGSEKMREFMLGHFIDPPFRNRILGALSQEAITNLRPHLEVISLERGEVLCEPHEALRRVYFVEGGIVSLMAMHENRATGGLATVGREGAVGVTSVLLGGKTAIGRHEVLVPGAAVAVDAAQLSIALGDNPKLRTLCEAYAQAFVAQMLQAVACSRLHTLEQRCARSLLMCDDQTGEEAVEIAQESLVATLSASRSAVDEIVSTLRKARWIRCRHGTISILERQGLEAAACECYRIVRERYQQMLAHAYA
jgi:CRP-like cAMP-binding protein